ncbi:MAG: phosphatase PAP2 family protein [Pseudohongiellaceae bacterium]
MSWIGKQIALTCGLLVLVIVSFEFTNLDIIVQDQLFDFGTGQWLWDKQEPVLKLLLYDGIKTIYLLGALTLLALVAFFGNLPSLADYKKGLIIVSISLLLVPGVVNAAKAISNIPCPVNLQHYGGDSPHVTLLSKTPDGFEQEQNARCYPAGHASGGFALLSLFFLCRSAGARRKTIAGVLVLAWTVGFYKMAIGDHFLSHTIVTMLLAWLLILVTARFIAPEYDPASIRK